MEVVMHSFPDTWVVSVLACYIRVQGQITSPLSHQEDLQLRSQVVEHRLL